MPVYFIANTKIKDIELLNDYITGAGDSLADFQGWELLVMDNDSEVMEGNTGGERTVVLKFDSKKNFSRWYNSEKYQAVIGKRFAATEGGMGVLAKGFEMPA
jgi:uncharacterized protein (DUF1330 family)